MEKINDPKLVWISNKDSVAICEEQNIRGARFTQEVIIYYWS